MTVFRKKKQLQRKKFLFLTENNVILIPFTNVHCNFTRIKMKLIIFFVSLKLYLNGIPFTNTCMA